MAKANAETIQNPIVYERADPWVYLHSDGYYYFTGSVPGYQSIELRRAKSLNELEDAERKTVWQAHESGPMSELIWSLISGISILPRVIMKRSEMKIIIIECS